MIIQCTTMRIIIFMLVGLLTVINAHAQTQPSQKEIQAQLSEARREALKHVSDLEKEIADAKLRGDDAENIKEMEKQLVTMRKMLGVIAKADTTRFDRPDMIPQVKTQVPEYVSPVVRIPVKQPLSIPTEAQAKDWLLWYKGKKLNDTMLVTTQGTVVAYSRTRNAVVVQADPRKDTTFGGIVKNLSVSRTLTDQYITKTVSEKNSFFNYPQVLITLNEFKFIEEAYNDIVRNTINLPWPEHPGALSSDHDDLRLAGPSSYPANNFTEPDDFLKILHQQLVDYMNNPEIIFGGSPGFEKRFDLCSYCDPSYQSEYYQSKKKWKNQFPGYELKLLGMMGTIRLLMMGKRITAAGSGIPNLEQDLARALKMAFDRWEEKVNKLERDAGENIHHIETVLESMLFFQSEKKKYYGTLDDNFTVRIRDRLKVYKNVFIKYFTELMFHLGIMK